MTEFEKQIVSYHKTLQLQPAMTEFLVESQKLLKAAEEALVMLKASLKQHKAANDELESLRVAMHFGKLQQDDLVTQVKMGAKAIYRVNSMVGELERSMNKLLSLNKDQDQLIGLLRHRGQY
ncbi:hypothetical protein AJ80_09948 [Polytolypa hystricis UAMH7299]|uniref:Uncharacterized protein n=1 Tax=Polytolypa hystricis (strain UAMH7299) TaxID=1447883 RepID=A0A2B7WFZ7_POLH7|nr:hypothetical protein AJ80_09948 [Polytolypa hystricis UAMH7299]